LVTHHVAGTSKVKNTDMRSLDVFCTLTGCQGLKGKVQVIILWVSTGAKSWNFGALVIELESFVVKMAGEVSVITGWE